MTDAQFEDPTLDDSMPEVVDDDYPERALVPNPEEPALPGEREQGYIGAGSVGTTTEEQIEGESLDEKLSHEVPEPTVDPLVAPDPDEGSDWDDEIDGGRLGQIVQPDQGTGEDVDKDEIAFEQGAASDLSPEERALHVERE